MSNLRRLFSPQFTEITSKDYAREALNKAGTNNMHITSDHMLMIGNHLYECHHPYLAKMLMESILLASKEKVEAKSKGRVVNITCSHMVPPGYIRGILENIGDSVEINLQNDFVKIELDTYKFRYENVQLNFHQEVMRQLAVLPISTTKAKEPIMSPAAKVTRVHAFTNLATAKAKTESADYGIKDEKIKAALAARLLTRETEAAENAVDRIMELIDRSDAVVAGSVTLIRKHRVQIAIVKHSLDDIARARAYGEETNNFIPLDILLNANAYEYESSLEDKSLMTVPADFKAKTKVEETAAATA